MSGAKPSTGSSDLVFPFDVDAFLAGPLVARLATAGPTVRPIWYLWEERTFWRLTGSYSRLDGILKRDPGVALVVDTCDLHPGEVQVVSARGRAEVVGFDPDRATRKLTRYLGADMARWDERFRAVFDDPASRLVRLVPSSFRAWDRSFSAADKTTFPFPSVRLTLAVHVWAGPPGALGQQRVGQDCYWARDEMTTRPAERERRLTRVVAEALQAYRVVVVTGRGKRAGPHSSDTSSATPAHLSGSTTRPLSRPFGTTLRTFGEVQRGGDRLVRAIKAVRQVSASVRLTLPLS